MASLKEEARWKNRASLLLQSDDKGKTFLNSSAAYFNCGANAEIMACKSSVIGRQISRNLDINPVTGRRVTWTRVTNQPPVGHRWGAGGWKGSSNGAEPNCNSCYHGSSRQRGGADGSLGRFTTTSFIQNLGKFLHG